MMNSKRPPRSSSLKKNRVSRSKTPRAPSRSRALRLSAPVASSLVTRPKPAAPTFSRVGNATQIQHNEYVFDLAGSTGYFVYTFAGNPGNSGLFPWLSNVATLFNSYCIESLRIRYEPSCSTSTPGVVILAFNPDGSDSPPLDKAALMSLAHFARGAPWEPISLDVPFKALRVLGHEKFVRATSSSSPSFNPVYDFGRVMFATSGQSDTANLGDIFIDYRVRLSEPSLIRSQVASLSFGNLRAVAPTRDDPFGSSLTQAYGGSCGISWTAGRIINFYTAGQYRVYVTILGATLVANSSPTVTATNCSVVSTTLMTASGYQGILYFDVFIPTSGGSASLVFQLTPCCDSVSTAYYNVVEMADFSEQLFP